MKERQKQAVGYARVSSAMQVENGVSLQAQRARIEAWCKAHDYKLLEVFEDAAVSGSRTDRPELAKAIKQCTEGVALVVFSLSRLGRSTRHVLELSEQLDRAGADLVSLSEAVNTTSAAGKMIFRLLAVLAEFERDLIGERTSAALQYKIDKGERAGQIPYGAKLARDGIRLLPNPAERKAIDQIKRLRTRGLSLRAIAEALSKTKHKPRGRQWYGQTVANILHANAT
jgi:DNA invertase Pin-like site-specific DNA recombinase